MGGTYPPAAAWGAQGASPLQPELLYICPGHFSSVTESSGHTIDTHLSHMLALWKVNVSQCSDARRDIKKFSAKLFFTVFSGSSAQSHGHAANDTGIVRTVVRKTLTDSVAPPTPSTPSRGVPCPSALWRSSNASQNIFCRNR
jgi:hypothetical protein